MTYEGFGRVIKGVGGLFTVKMRVSDGNENPLDGKNVYARGRGNLRQKGSLLVGDLVRVAYDDSSFAREGGEVIPSHDGTGIVIEEICERSCALIRPPMANLNLLFVTLAAASPDPVFETVDKLISIAEYNHIEPVIVIGKRDMAPDYADELAALYQGVGYSAFALSAESGDGVAPLQQYIKEHMSGKTAAFAGASGVGKSTLLNALFPGLSLQTGEISRRIERGRHTTRRVELYPVEGMAETYVADTPGFSMLDFVRFDFFQKEDLAYTMREFDRYLGDCRYKKCTHTREEGCAILEAMRKGEIAPSRHQSYVGMFDALKNKHDWSKK